MRKGIGTKQYWPVPWSKWLFKWRKEHINEVNITLEMLGEAPLVIQEGEKKEIGNLSPSNNDKLTRSQSLFKRITIDSSNSHDIINNLNNLKSISTKLDGNDFLTAINHSFFA